MPASSNFDTRNSRLSLFVFKSLTPEKMEEAMGNSSEYFSGKLTPEEYLEKLDKNMVTAIAHASASMVLLRRDKLMKYGSAR